MVTSLADNSLNNTSNSTISFPICPTENLCGGPAYIPNYSDLSTMQIYVSLDLDDGVLNNIIELEFSFSDITFGITYNKQKSEETDFNIDNVTFGWEVFDIIDNADILNDTLELVKKKELIIPQIKYENNNFYIYSPNVILK